MSQNCKAIDCSKRAKFGFKDDEKATYCSPHGILLGMVDIVTKRCLGFGCDNKSRLFGFKRDKSGTYCYKHKLDGMVDIVTKRCLELECDSKKPSFGFPDDKSGTYCEKHKLDGMVDIVHKRCLDPDCDSTSRTFGFLTDKNGTFCEKHKITGMIDIVSKRCLEINCDSKHPSFGFSIDKSGTYCEKHKISGMINIRAKKCLDPDCDSTSRTFGFPTDKNGTFCEKHKITGMINIRSKRCETCKLTQMNPKYKPNCAKCYFYLNPDDPRIRNYKTKEQAYMAALLEKFPQFKLDKTIDGGCSKRRPDGFLDLLTHVIIIEIDENEHKSYDDTCNNRRTMELSQDVNHRPIVFIRLNPDGYTLDDKRIKGSFSLTKATGELKIVKKEFNKRLNSLIESVKKYLVNEPDKTILVEYLYFTK